MSDAPYAVVIGAANIDICGAPKNALRTQDSNPGTVLCSPGGVARNIAENLARLGAVSRLVATVGVDHYGDLLLEQGRAAGIDMDYMLQLDSAQTSTYISILNESGDMFVAINDMSIANDLRPERLRLHEQMIRQSSLIIADTNLGEDVLAYISETFLEQPLFIDVVSTVKATRIKPYLNSIHTLKASRNEAEALSGIQAQDERRLADIANWFHECGVARVFVTLDAEGVFYSDGETQAVQDTGVHPPAIVNTSGAGDAFVAGIAYAWLQQWSLAKSVRFAISAATVALSHRATINPEMSATAVKQLYAQQYAR